ncbi:MAG: methyltransferase domain-containing protein [Caldimonas sp.]
MIGALRGHMRRQQFDPGLSGAFVNPFFLARRALRREIAQASPALTGPLLDVGCGTKPYRTLFETEAYVGLDIDSEHARALGAADAYYDGHRFPFEDAQFRAVLCNQVLEHVFNPDEFLGEIRRVLQVGGRLLLTVPFVWDEHEQPHDFARYSSFGLKALLERNGFRVLRHRKLLADASILFQLLNAYLFKITLSRVRILNRLTTAFVLGPLSLVGLVLGHLLPDNPDLFLDQLVVAERL